MECPVCGDRLRGVEKYGVEIEICPGCKGVWLDRGELETIINTTSGASSRSHGDHPLPHLRRADRGVCARRPVGAPVGDGARRLRSPERSRTPTS